MRALDSEQGHTAAHGAKQRQRAGSSSDGWAAGPLADTKQATKRKSPVWTGRGGRLLALPRERQMDSYHGAFGGTLMALTIYPECVLPVGTLMAPRPQLTP
jgi:hypothetical protein